MTDLWRQLTEFPAADRSAWRSAVDKALKGRPFDDALIKHTAEGLPLAPLYTRDDLPEGVASERPGAAPFTRGFPSPSDGASRRGWIRGVEVEHPDPVHANRMLLADLTGGAERVVIKAASRRQLASASIEQRRAQAESGRGGVWLADASDLDALLNGVLWPLAPVTIVPPADDPDWVQWLLAACATLRTERGEGLHTQLDLAGCAWAASDPASWLHRYSPLALEGIPYDRERIRTADARPLLISTAALRMAGADAVQEIAAALGLFVAVSRTGDGVLPRERSLRAIEFRFATGVDLFAEIVKLRAFRRCLGLVLETLGIVDRAGDAFVTASSAEELLMRRDVYVNLLRTTAEAAAAVIGGADCVIALPFNLRNRGGTALGRRMARNLHALLAEESDAGAVADPAGGSFYVEHRTEQLAAAAWQQFVEWERAGGFVTACANGAVAAAVGARRQAHETRVRSRRDPILGVSMFPDLGEAATEHDLFDTDGLLARWRDARGGEAAATPSAAPARSVAEVFEQLRDRADRLTARGTPPTLLAVLIGEAGTYAARLDWTRDLLASGGIRLELATLDDDVASGFERGRFAGAILVAADALHGTALPPAAADLRRAGAGEIVVAGRPGPHEGVLREAGVTRFVHTGADAVTCLDALLTVAEADHAVS